MSKMEELKALCDTDAVKNDVGSQNVMIQMLLEELAYEKEVNKIQQQKIVEMSMKIAALGELLWRVEK